MLSLDDFNFKKITFNKDELLNSKNDNPFNSLGIELFKELAVIVSLLGNIYQLDDQNKPRLWNIEEAVLGGMMIRILKLMSGFLNEICDNHMEIANIITRCIAETSINLKYLLANFTPGLIKKFITYSLRSEKKLLQEIENNISERGDELPIEKRMKISINRSFERSNIDTDDIDTSDRSTWGGSIYNRFQELGFERAYISIFGIQSHFVHGNWQELLFYHLEYKDGKFKPKSEWSPVYAQPIFALGILIGETATDFLEFFLPECEDKVKLKEKLEGCVSRIIEADKIHEDFLQKQNG